MTVKCNQFSFKVLNTIYQQLRAERTYFLVIKLNSFDTQEVTIHIKSLKPKANSTDITTKLLPIVANNLLDLK